MKRALREASRVFEGDGDLFPSFWISLAFITIVGAITIGGLKILDALQ